MSLRSAMFIFTTAVLVLAAFSSPLNIESDSASIHDLTDIELDSSQKAYGYSQTRSRQLLRAPQPDSFSKCNELRRKWRIARRAANSAKEAAMQAAAKWKKKVLKALAKTELVRKAVALTNDREDTGKATEVKEKDAEADEKRAREVAKKARQEAHEAREAAMKAAELANKAERNARAAERMYKKEKCVREPSPSNNGRVIAAVGEGIQTRKARLMYYNDINVEQVMV